MPSEKRIQVPRVGVVGLQREAGAQRMRGEVHNHVLGRRGQDPQELGTDGVAHAAGERDPHVLLVPRTAMRRCPSGESQTATYSLSNSACRL